MVDPRPADSQLPGNGTRSHPRSLMQAFGRVVVRGRWLVVAVWALLIVASAFLAPRFEASLTGPPLAVGGADSQRVQELLEARFEQRVTEQVLVVFESTALAADDPAFRQVVEAALAAVKWVPGVAGIAGPFAPGAVDQVSADGYVATAAVGLVGSNAERQAAVRPLRAAAESAATADVAVYLTGQSPLIAELVEQERRDLARAERLGLPAALLILLVTSRTLVAAVLPVLLGVIGIAVTFGFLGLGSFATDYNLFVPNIATMLGLGVGIDYSLFVVTRFREELASGADPAAAVATAVATAGKTVFFSAATVLLSLSGLFIVDAQIFHELAAGAMAAVAVMAAGALTLVPVLLSLLGHRVERLRVPFLRGAAAGGAGGAGWAWWAGVVMRRPALWAVVAVAVLLLMAAPITRLRLSLDTGTGELGPRSAAAGREILEREFDEGRLSPVQVAYVSRDGALDDADLDAIDRLGVALAEDWAVIEVRSVTTVLDRFAGDHSAATLDLAADFPRAVDALSTLVNIGRGQDIAIVQAVPLWSPDSPGPLQLVERVRNEIVPRVVADGGSDAVADVYVGGLSAQIVDISAESGRKLPVVAGLVVAMSFVLLALVFRSLVLPLKAIVMNGLSIAAAYGLLVVVFQEGAGERIFDFTATGTTQVYLPLLSFAVLFGLSMDYEVFLLGRIKEEWERTGDNRTAVALGLQRTAGVISSAAAIMVAVFAAFTFAQLREVKELGFSLAAAVLIDATLVRIILVPAAMQLMGRWNWWFPGWLDRVVPRINLSEGTAQPVQGSGAGPGANGSEKPGRRYRERQVQALLSEDGGVSASSGRKRSVVPASPGAKDPGLSQ